MSRITRLCIAVLLVTLSLALHTVQARADSPGTAGNPSCNPSMTVCHWSLTISSSIDDWADCPAFTVASTYTVSRNYTDFYDASGNFLREIRHVQYTGTLFNTSTGASVPYEGSFEIQIDATAGTFRTTGLNTMITLPNGAHTVLDAGFALFDANGNATVHGISNDGQICTVLG